MLTVVSLTKEVALTSIKPFEINSLFPFIGTVYTLAQFIGKEEMR